MTERKLKHNVSNPIFLSLLLIWFAWSPRSLNAQFSNPQKSAAELWSIIEPQLKETPRDSSLQLIDLLVQGNCGEDFECLYGNLAHLKNKLEQRFDLRTAIAICERMVELAQHAKKLDAEAKAHLDLQRFDDALGKDREAAFHLDRAEQLFVASNNQSALLQLRMNKQEKSLEYRSSDEVIPELEALLSEAIELGDQMNVNRLHLRLMLHTLNAGKYKKAERHLNAIESIPVSSPPNKGDYKYLIYSALGRADLAKASGDLGQAMCFYQKCLQYCEAEPSRWMEIYTLLKMARVEMEREYLSTAKSFLDSAEVKATKLNLDDHLASTYRLKTQLAEAEERYADALVYAKKQRFHEERFQNRGAGFDLQKHELAKEKEMLAAETAKQEAELKEKDSLIKVLMSLGIGLLLSLGGFVVYRQQESPEVKSPERLPSERKLERHPLTQEDETGKPGPTLPEADRVWLRNFNGYLESNLSNEKLTIPIMASDFAMSESSLLRQVKKLTGMPPAKYLQKMRMEKGQELLENRRFDSVAKVASEVGYRDVRSFSRSFKKRFGRLPSEFLNN